MRTWSLYYSVSCWAENKFEISKEKIWMKKEVGLKAMMLTFWDLGWKCKQIWV